MLGNHDITLDAPFYHAHGQEWKWPRPQDPAACRELLASSTSITYLENQATTVKLTSPNGPKTCFTVFGSPCTPKHANWAFQYEAQDAEEIWRKIPAGVDVVITHTPPEGLCDAAKDDRSGCPALKTRLWEVRPALSVCGHIHGGRGVERARWMTDPDDSGSLVESIDYWTDPGKGNKKLSLVDLGTKSGRPLVYCGGGLTRQDVHPSSLDSDIGGQPDLALSLPQIEGPRQPRSGDGNLIPTPSLPSVALGQSEALLRGDGVGDTMHVQSDIGQRRRDKAARQFEMDGCQRRALAGKAERKETVVINAAYLGPRVAGKAIGFNKAIVVDVDLPVWSSAMGDEVG